MHILAIQPYLTRWLASPSAGGKDRIAWQIACVAVAAGHSIDVLPWPVLPHQWPPERYRGDHVFTLDDTGANATARAAKVRPRLADAFGSSQRTKSLRSHLWHAARRAILLPSLRRAVALGKPDLIHVHQSFSDVALFAREIGINTPILMTHHTPGLSPLMMTHDHVVFVNSGQRDAAIAQWPDLADRSQVISCAVDDVFCNAPLYEGEPDDRIVFVGLLSDDRKGLDILIEAYRREPTLARYELVVVGDGPMRDIHEAKAHEYNLNVRFVGRQLPSEIVELLRTSRLFVMPSRAESFGIVYAEALCLGVPIVGYTPSVTEIERIMEMPIGAGFDPATEDASQLARVITAQLQNRLAAEPKARSEIARRARQQFALTRFGKQYMELYDQLVG